jgi:serine phosphatase RsbU (regulator of sigma subunit)
LCLKKIKTDRIPIGIYVKEKESFTLNGFDYQPGDTFYIFSDGCAYQFGAPQNLKFIYKALKELLESLQEKLMAEQKEILNQTFINWMGQTNQIDDQVVIGVRLV